MLAEYVEREPDKIENIKVNENEDSIPENLRSLFKDERVKEVITCNHLKGINPTVLDEKTIREFTGRLKYENRREKTLPILRY